MGYLRNRECVCSPCCIWLVFVCCVSVEVFHVRVVHIMRVLC